MSRHSNHTTQWLILMAVAFTTVKLQAQTFIGSWTQTSPAVTCGVDTNGTFFSTAPFTNAINVNSAESDTSGTPQFLWIPSYAAFRGGGSFYSAPSTTDMGAFSFAFGFTTTATNFAAAAFGVRTIASGMGSFGAGSSNSAGDYATATGTSTAVGPYSVSLGSSYATGQYAVALGNTGAEADGGVAIGEAVNCGGYFSTVGIGNNLNVNCYSSVALGCYNVGGGNNGQWIPTDPLLEVGNGTASTPSDALVVYKNGNETVQGTITAQGGVVVTPASVLQTDIPMYSGN